MKKDKERERDKTCHGERLAMKKDSLSSYFLHKKKKIPRERESGERHSPLSLSLGIFKRTRELANSRSKKIRESSFPFSVAQFLFLPRSF